MDEISQHARRDRETGVTVLSLGCAAMGVVCGRVINRIEIG
ncbi:hypothetical protein [Marivita sp.]